MKKWNKEIIQRIKQLYDDHTYKEIAGIINEEYGLNKTPNAIRKTYQRYSGGHEIKHTPVKNYSKDDFVFQNNTDDGKYSNVLVISDMHIPYHHPDMLDFLKAVKRKYKPDKVICIGDEVDKHAMSFHDSDPDLPSAGDELQEAIKVLKEVYKIFPTVDLVDSNHGSMHYRKGKHHGIPRKYLKDYKEILEAPEEWNWHNDLRVSCSDGSYVYFHHGLKKKGLPVAQQMGMSFVQGHFHTEYCIDYSSTPEKLIWNMTVGCLIDDDSLAFAYNKTTLGRPIIGLGVIIDGQPELVPMILNHKGRWIGELR